MRAFSKRIVESFVGTPSPAKTGEKWQAELLPNGDWGIYEGADRDYRIALVENDDATGQDSENAEMCRANANLIAVAPTLLAALEQIAALSTPPASSEHQASEIARAAIEKAGGL